MAVSKAQLVVWALIAGVSVGGYTVLSRIELADDMSAEASVVRAAVAEPRVVAAKPGEPVVAVAEALPATIPEFPFPDDLATATVGGQPGETAPQVTAFAEIPGDAIPQISTVSNGEVAAGVVDTAALGISAPEPALVAAAAEEPPIPMPSRPVVAQPVKAVPLSEVKTLYVVADALNVRAVPSTSAPVLQKLPQGFAVAAREQSNEWIGFLMRDGSTGWMRTDYLSDTMPVPAQASTSPLKVWTEPLNLMM